MIKKYLKYRNSNTVWLGEIPEYWDVKKVKHVAYFYTGWTPPSGSDEYYNGDYPWANISDLGKKYLETTTKTITQEAIESLRMKLSHKGSLLFSFKLSIGLVSMLRKDMYTNEAIATFPPNDKIETTYLYYMAPVAIPMNAGINIYNAPMLNQDSIKNAIIVYPPISEQQAIAAFLDHETSRIDALIQKKERMIELLKEKRIALITQAVTKGLDPNVKMKDSGIEWLGEVPEHWITTKVGSGYSIQLGKMLQPEPDKASDIAVKYLKSVNVQWENVTVDDDSTMWASDNEIHKYKVQKGDLLVCEGGEAGRAAILESDVGVMIIQNALHRVRSSNNDVRYLLYVLHVASHQGWFDILCNKATIAHFTRDKFSELRIPYPPRNEQETIVSHIQKRSLSINKTIEHLYSSISLLQEYRSSLIHSAVTGKIDLRGYNE